MVGLKWQKMWCLTVHHLLQGNLLQVYISPQKKKLLAFSFANFEITRWSTERQYVSWYNYLIIQLKYTDQEKLLPNFIKFKLNKRGVSFFFWGSVQWSKKKLNGLEGAKYSPVTNRALQQGVWYPNIQILRIQYHPLLDLIFNIKISGFQYPSQISQYLILTL